MRGVLRLRSRRSQRSPLILRMRCGLICLTPLTRRSWVLLLMVELFCCFCCVCMCLLLSLLCCGIASRVFSLCVFLCFYLVAFQCPANQGA